MLQHGKDDVSDPSGTFLEVRRSGDASTRVPLDGVTVTVGRAADANVVLDHPSVSRSHAQLTVDPGGRWWVRDLGSRNGTTVNGTRVREAAVNLGDVIGLGEYKLKLVSGREKSQGSTSSTVPAAGDGPGITLRTLGEGRPPHIAAEHIAGVMELGRRLQQTAASADRLRRLLEFAVGPELQGLSASALRLSGSGPELLVENLCEPVYRARSARTPPHLSRSLLSAVVARGQPVVANNLVRLPQFQADVSIVSDTTPFSAVVCPLAPGDVRDVLYVVQPPSLGSVEWLMLTSLAVEQYRQGEAAWAARAEAARQAAIGRELDLARVIQLRTVPRRRADDRIDWALSFAPCHGVGGDYVDVIRRADGSVLLAIADVSGKGMQAALVTAAIHAVFHTLARTGAPLAEIATAANRHLRTFLPDGGFATLAAVALDPESGRGQSVNCGHLPALAAGAGEAARLIPGGDNLPLGLADEPPATEPFELVVGDCLVLHTDGLNELRGSTGGMIGLRALREQFARVCAAAASAESAVAELSRWLDAHAGGCAPSDDRTFLVARRV